MKRAVLFIIVMVVLAFALLRQGRSLAQRQRAQIPRDRVAQRAERTPNQVATTQQRINRYFHNDVVPKLKECWRGVQGRGLVQFDYSFTRTGSGRWVLDQVSASGNTLPAGEGVKALRCMEAATRRTSFAPAPDDTNERTFVLHWDWPVPLPVNSDALRDAMFAMRVKNDGGTSTTDCDGHGALPKCFTCVNYECKKVCVGSKECSTNKGRNFETCFEANACASGGIYGIGGGSRVIF